MSVALAPNLNESIAFLTSVESESPSVSGSVREFYDNANSFQVLYPSFSINSISYAKNRIMKRVENPTFEIYDLKLEYSSEFDKAIRFSNLLTKIQKEYSLYKNYLNIEQHSFNEVVNMLANNIANINYEKISVEITPLNEIKFKTFLSNNVLLIITKPFEDLESNSSLVFYSIFINKKSVLNDYKKIEELAEGINQFLQ